MTRDELNRRRMMFQIYANRNKMPQLQKNDNEEPLKHSATNEYLEYRKKVAAGMKMQRDNRPSDLFNVTEANEQYYQDLMDQNIIIHAGMNNQYIAKLDDFYGKGKPRYFYDQTEWDNYRKNMQGAGQAGANRGAREGADARNKALANAGQKAYADARKNSVNAVIDNAKSDLKNKALAEAGQKAFENSQKNGALTTAQSRREAAIANSRGGSKEDASDVTNTVRDYNASRKEYEKNAQANPEAQRAQKMKENAEREETDNISNTVKNYNASKREWEKNAQANPEAQRGAKESERVNAQKQAANQSGSANAAKAQGEAYDEYMNNKKQASNQSGSANAARAEGEGYDRYKKDVAEREAFREESEREALNYQEREGNKKESAASGKNEAQRALKDTASNIANSKNPAKEIASNKTYSKYIDDIVELIDSGAAEIGSDGTIHIDKTKNPKAVYKITNDDVIALNTELLKNGMTQRSINAAVMDEIEKRAKASKENKGQSGIESFMNGSKANKGISSFMQSSKDSKKAKSKAMSANQSGSGNAAAAEGERRDIERERAAWEEEQRRADAYDIDHGKKKKYASARHDGLEDGITTEDISPEQEYLDFRARVEEGMKHYSMAKGLMSIPVNQNLAHAGTGKYGDYYNKIDNYYGPGKARYFKTKDEWDAHQRELDSYKKKAEKDVAERDRKIAQQNEWNKNSQANPGAQRGAQEYITGRLTNKQNQKETANRNYYNTQSNANPEQRRGFTEAAQGRLAGSNFTPLTTSNGFNSRPNANLYGLDNDAAAKNYIARNSYQSSYRNDLLNKAQSGREAAIRNSAPGIDKDIQRRKFLEINQSGREAAMNNSSNNSASVQRLLNNLSAPVPENVKAAWEARAKALDEAGQTEVYRQQLDHLEKRVAADEFAWRAQDIIESALRSSKVDYDTKDEIRDSLKKIRKLVNDHGYFDDPEYDKALNKMINNNDYYMEPERRARENANLSYKMDQIEKDYDDKKFKDMSRTLQSIMFNLEPEVRSQIFAQLADAGIDYDYLANGNSSTTLSNILEDLYGDKLRERTDI